MTVPRTAWTAGGIGIVSVAVAALLALAVTGRLPRGGDGAAGPAPDSASSAPAAPTSPAPLDPAAAAARFLDTYVDADGRVVRHDQGGDTVSEGQAYAMLLAITADRETTFRRVWSWTAAHLRRPDGVLSWRWSDGAVADPESAADADLDAARALVLAGDRFADDGLRADGMRLGSAVLDAETATTPIGRILLAGTWATTAPYAVNPSYASPVATAVLGTASGDPRWDELATGSRAMVEALVAPAGSAQLSARRLPPDWASVGADGQVRPAAGPQGQSPQFSFDAVRLPVRFAESCDPADRALAGRLLPGLGDEGAAHTTYDLAGSPQDGAGPAVGWVARAAARASTGDDAGARSDLRSAAAADAAAPTYYGAAWTALGAAMLTTRSLGGCPPIGAGA